MSKQMKTTGLVEKENYKTIFQAREEGGRSIDEGLGRHLSIFQTQLAPPGHGNPLPTDQGTTMGPPPRHHFTTSGTNFSNRQKE
jgi:hypothetical protein